MFGNLAGQGMNAGVAGPIMANPVAGGSMTPQPPPPVAGPPSTLSIIMKALQDPATMAQKMADAGISPQDFQAAMKSQHNLADTMAKTEGPKANADSAFGPERAKGALTTPQSKVQQYDIFGGHEDAFGQRSPSMFADQGTYNESANPDKFITLDDLKKFFQSENPTVGNLGARTEYLGNNPQMVAGSNAPPNAYQPPIAPPVVPPVAATGVTQPSPMIGPFPPRAGETPGGLPAAPPNANLPVIGADYKPSGNMGGAQGTAPNLTGNEIYDGFMGVVKQKVTNPFGLAAIAATGKSESGFNASNAYGSWNDVGAPAGGIMSWRGARLDAMKAFVKANGGDPNKPSPELQGQFLLQENPGLIDALNAAKSPEEAQKLMNNAWAFKGYQDSAHGEAARRIALATNMASQFSKGENPDIGKAGDTAASAPASTPASATSTTPTLNSKLADMAAALQNGGGGSDWSNMDMNLPKAPSPVPPRPGQYDPSAQIKQIMLAMLYGGGAPQIPSLGQLIGR